MLFRKIIRNKYIILLKVISMSLGVASALILLYIVANEYNNDGFYKDKKQIYQVFVQYKSPDWTSTGTQLIQPVVPAMVRDFSAIEAGTVVFNSYELYYNYNNNSFKAQTIYADSQYFKVFSRAFVVKKTDDILSGIDKAVVVKSFAKKIFGSTSAAISKVIKLNGCRPIEIEAVIENWPANSSQKPEVIISMATLKDEKKLYMGWDGGDSFQGYIKLRKNSKPEIIESGIPDFIRKYVDIDKEKEQGISTKYMLIPITKANLAFDDFKKIYLSIYVFVAILILGLVSFNTLLLKLSTYTAFRKDIAVRRILGASPKDLQKMVLIESLFYVLAIIILSTVFIGLLNPFIKDLYHFNFFELLLNPAYIWIAVIVFALIFFINYWVPANRIIHFLKKSSNRIHFHKSNRLQGVLLTLQMGISLSLFIFLYYIQAQLSYINNFDKGYNTGNLVYIELNNEALYKKHWVLKNEILKLNNVQAVCLSDGIFTQGLSGNGFYDNPDAKEVKIFRQLSVGTDFFKTMGMKLQGENFTAGGNNRYIVVNREVGKTIHSENPVGKYLYRGGERKIIGVVPNFITGSLHSKMQPTVFVKYTQPSVYSVISIRISNNDMYNTINAIKETINSIAPNQLYQIRFYDDDIRENYQFDRSVEKTMIFFAFLALVITISGLIGFSINTVNKRTKEIGIRKVNGATALSLLVFLNKRFVLNITFTLLFFIPLSYYLVKLWLQNYAYAVDVNPVAFMWASILLASIVLTIVSLTTYKYANSNPVNILRYE